MVDMKFQHPKLLLERDGLFLLTHEWKIEWDHKGIQMFLVVPAGIKSDLASVPRIFTPLVSRTELGFAAPLVHDWIYRQSGILIEGYWTRKQTDRLFCRIMRNEEVPRWKRRMAYKSVRALGWYRWGKKTAKPVRMRNLKQIELP